LWFYGRKRNTNFVELIHHFQFVTPSFTWQIVPRNCVCVCMCSCAFGCEALLTCYTHHGRGGEVLLSDLREANITCGQPNHLLLFKSEQPMSQVIFGRVRINIFFPWKSNKFYSWWVGVCSLRYPACKAHALYFIVICDLSGRTIFFFPNYLINGTILWKKCCKK